MIHRLATRMLGLGLVLSATNGHAEPSVWARAADPETAAVAEARTTVEALRSELFVLGRSGMTFPARVMVSRAITVLERAGVSRTDDPALRYQLAQLYESLHRLDPEPDHAERALAHYAFAAQHPNTTTTLRSHAFSQLAIAHAQRGEHDREVEAYEGALAIEPDPNDYARLLANQAEGQMARGRITEAISGYRAALRNTSTMAMLDQGVTTLWGLAVALDRSGDLAGALEQIALARRYDPNDLRLQSDGWFFVPAYDAAWYAALGDWHQGRTESRMSDRDGAYRAGIAAFRSFIDRAAPDDPWLPLAPLRLSELEREYRAFNQRRTALERAAPD